MGVSGISGSMDSSAAREMSARIFKKMDADGNGSVSKEELRTASEEMKKNAPKDAPKGLPSVDDLFATTDADGDGGISQDELFAELSKHRGPPPGAPPADSGGSAGAASDTSSSSSSSSSAAKAQDAADLDGDGTVTGAERRAYEYNLLMNALAKATEGSASSSGSSMTAQRTAFGGAAGSVSVTA